MKNFTLIILFVLAMFRIHAQQQDYLITFSGEGDTTGLTSVQVINMTQGDTVYLTGGETLHLKSTLGINSQGLGQNKSKRNLTSNSPRQKPKH